MRRGINESVHLAAYPVADEALIDADVEAPMDLVRDLVSLGRSAREDGGIKVRQPLSKVIVDGKYQAVLGDLTDLLKEELNIKTVDFEDDLGKFITYTVKPNFKVAGPILGPKVKLLGKAMASADAAALVAATAAGEAYAVRVGKPRVGVVGEILVKFQPDANNHVIDQIEAEGCEAVVPGLLGFFLNGPATAQWETDTYGIGKDTLAKKKAAVWFLEQMQAPAVDRKSVV